MRIVLAAVLVLAPQAAVAQSPTTHRTAAPSIAPAHGPTSEALAVGAVPAPALAPALAPTLKPALAPPAAAKVAAPALVAAVQAPGFTVADMDREVEFFTKVLSFEKVSDVEVAGDAYERLEGVFGARMRVVGMKLGNERLELTEYLAPRGRPIPVDSRSNDRWFQHVAIIVSDMDRAYRWLRENKVEHASSGPQRLPDWNPNAGGIEAFYFKDPEDHVLEILQFPPGKGDPKWAQPAGRMFLGIDHTAIVVSDTDASLRFYRDGLGMRVAGESENYGPEQERLNNVFGARLRITGLRAPSGPGIELLEYLAPRDGRPAPSDARSNDLLHWQTRLVTADAQAAARALQAGRFALLSGGPVALPAGELEFRRGFLVRDPDGHVMELVDGSGASDGPRAQR